MQRVSSGKDVDKDYLTTFIWCRTKPRSFNSLLKHSTGGQGGHSQLATGDDMEIDESSKVTEADEETAELPPSPTRNFGGLASL